ncbi:MAG: HIT family protein [Muribaculaceae bacterium]|nr:HIT family protein [Muribaculaceae bacterium]
MATIFSRIAAGEIPSFCVGSDDKHYAFLDIAPMAKGHTLVIPRREVDYLFDLTQEEYSELMEFARKMALKIQKAIPCKRVGIAVIGMEVPHAHIHLIPINAENDMDFRRPKLQLTQEEMAGIAKSIAEAE